MLLFTWGDGKWFLYYNEFDSGLVSFVDFQTVKNMQLSSFCTQIDSFHCLVFRCASLVVDRDLPTTFPVHNFGAWTTDGIVFLYQMTCLFLSPFFRPVRVKVLLLMDPVHRKELNCMNRGGGVYSSSTINLNIADRRDVITSLMNSRERTLAIANK